MLVQGLAKIGDSHTDTVHKMIAFELHQHLCYLLFPILRPYFLVNAFIAQGGRASAVRAGTSYVDVGTLHGYREALNILDVETSQDRNGTGGEIPHVLPAGPLHGSRLELTQGLEVRR